MAEDAATADQLSNGRLEFGVGRGATPIYFAGYNVSQEESRERFEEALEVILQAWTNERLSYQGKHFQVQDVPVAPRPMQKPYPPIRIAATTRETFPQVGRMGHPIFVGLRGMDRPEVAHHLSVYREAWQEAGHPKDSDVILRIPVYVAETEKQALSEPEVSTMSSYRRMAENFARSAAGSGTTVSEERAERGRRLANVTYEDLLRDRVAYGTPDAVAEQIKGMQEELGLSGVIAEMNVGGLVPKERVLNSLRLFGEQVVPHFK
jgi:alkanesulfonate monooxygenase SsuD/methylene tetrahydromethanopterin reductase-like flavin-dependent oxidoreductase (luciferase family)